MLQYLSDDQVNIDPGNGLVPSGNKLYIAWSNVDHVLWRQ